MKNVFLFVLLSTASAFANASCPDFSGSWIPKTVFPSDGGAIKLQLFQTGCTHFKAIYYYSEARSKAGWKYGPAVSYEYPIDGLQHNDYIYKGARETGTPGWWVSVGFVGNSLKETVHWPDVPVSAIRGESFAYTTYELDGSGGLKATFEPDPKNPESTWWIVYQRE